MRKFHISGATIQIAIGIIAVAISIYALYRTSEAEKFAMETIILREKATCLRSMAGEGASVSSDSRYRPSTDDKKNTAIVKLLNSGLEYKRIFTVYGYCLKKDSANAIKQKITEFEMSYGKALAAINNEQQQQYIDSGSLQELVNLSVELASDLNGFASKELDEVSRIVKARHEGKL